MHVLKLNRNGVHIGYIGIRVFRMCVRVCVCMCACMRGYLYVCVFITNPILSLDLENITHNMKPFVSHLCLNVLLVTYYPLYHW